MNPHTAAVMNSTCHTNFLLRSHRKTMAPKNMITPSPFILEPCFLNDVCYTDNGKCDGEIK